MVAEIKSHVLRRDEKGLLGIPFKRWLLSGVTGGMALAITGIVLSGLGIPIGAGVALGVLILSGPRQGLPLWERLLYQVRGALVVQAARQPTSLAARLATWLDIPVQSITRLDGDRLFADPTPAEAGDLSEWVSRVRADDDDLIIVDRPFDSSEGLP